MKKTWGNKKEQEIKRRINVSLWAYAYEVENDSLVSDGKYDSECLKVDLSISTGNKIMDKFFKNEFDPDTGLWIHKHPQIEGIKFIYEKYHEL